MRSFTQTPFENNYSEDEIKYFNAKFFERFKELDINNTADLKEVVLGQELGKNFLQKIQAT